MRRSLTDGAVHYSGGLCLLERRLLLLEAGLLWEGRLLLVASGLRGEAVHHASGSRLELLARRVGEWRAGLLALVDSLLVADTHALLAELRLSKL